jgi:hypothetical protein
MNQKGTREAEILNRAKNEGRLAKFRNLRRPFNQSESNADYVGTDSTGAQIEFEIKGIDGSGKRAYNRQTNNIIENIKDLFDVTEDPKKLQVICDISMAPTFLQKIIFNNMTKALDSDQRTQVDFLFNESSIEI